MAFGSAALEIFVLNGLMHIDALDVRQGAEPCEDVGEFLFLVFLIVAVDGGGEFSDFLHEPAESRPDAPLRIASAVTFADVLLKFLDGHLSPYGCTGNITKGLTPHRDQHEQSQQPQFGFFVN